MTSSSVHSIQVSDGGVPKLPVREARITFSGLEGDRQRNRRYHGGPARAVCLFSLERIEALQREGHPIGPGTTGENLTVRDLDWDLVKPGVRVRAGTAELQVTSFSEPCNTIRNSFTNNDISRMSEREFPGWSRVYARVLKEGFVKAGDSVEVLQDEQTSLI
jgi:MOSC domain-containing protein YiiM